MATKTNKRLYTTGKIFGRKEREAVREQWVLKWLKVIYMYETGKEYIKMIYGWFLFI